MPGTLSKTGAALPSQTLEREAGDGSQRTDPLSECRLTAVRVWLRAGLGQEET